VYSSKFNSLNTRHHFGNASTFLTFSMQVSAWLKNSNDTIKGNWKRNDQYWGAVTAMFNSTTPSDRTREIKQLKEQWHRVNRTVNAFQGSWMKA